MTKVAYVVPKQREPSLSSTFEATTKMVKTFGCTAEQAEKVFTALGIAAKKLADEEKALAESRAGIPWHRRIRW